MMHNRRTSMFIHLAMMLAVPAAVSFAQTGHLKLDLHQHTTYTDGSYSFATMMYMNHKYGLDWWANSEHGGAYSTNAAGALMISAPFGPLSGSYFDAISPNPILGDSLRSGGHKLMWRWQSIRDYSFADIKTARSQYSSHTIFQGYEWNVPSHEHCSVAIIANQFNAQADCNPLAQFEYMFDDSDKDTTGGKVQGWTKSTKSGHAKAVEAITWLQTNYASTSWVIFNHPERKAKYTIADFRDFSNAGPGLVMGFESMPGHQKGPVRGEYTKSSGTVGTCTYGGVGTYAATIGGVWDALLGEGRRWLLETNSDCHNVGSDAAMMNGADFFPGEYQKTYALTSSSTNPHSIVDGMRTGNMWIVSGDLIDSLDFKINSVTMGQAVQPASGKANITIAVRDPQTQNFNTYSAFTNPVLDHIDVIAGNVTGVKTPGSADYSIGTNATAKVVARFDSVGGVTDANNIVSTKWTSLANGVKTMSISINAPGAMYFRLRGTNWGLNVTNETDGAGNPKPDTLVAATAASAFQDLWFYSNAIFVGTSTGVSNNVSSIPGEFQLAQNYPNPFNPSTQIAFSLPTTTYVSLKVFDMLGREVATLANGFMQAGQHTVSFNAQNLASGVYLYKLQAGEFSSIKKMVLMK